MSDFLKELAEPKVLMSRLKNFCTITFWDFRPTKPEHFDQIPEDIKVCGQYVDVGALNEEVKRLMAQSPGVCPNPDLLICEAVLNIIGSND